MTSTTNLSEHEHHQLMAVLRELDPNAPAEKRKHPRRKVIAAIEIQLTAIGKAVPATLKNVSPKGAALTTTRPILPNERMILPLQFREGGGWLVLAIVRNARRMGLKNYQVGVEFVERLDALDSPVPPHWLGL